MQAQPNIRERAVDETPSHRFESELTGKADRRSGKNYSVAGGRDSMASTHSTLLPGPKFSDKEWDPVKFSEEY
jgi:hypothetical protein